MSSAKPPTPRGRPSGRAEDGDDARDPARAETPNALTRKTIADAEAGKDVVRCADAEDLFRKLGL